MHYVVIAALAACLWLWHRSQPDDTGELRLGCDPLGTPEEHQRRLLMAGIGAGPLSREGDPNAPPPARGFATRPAITRESPKPRIAMVRRR